MWIVVVARRVVDDWVDDRVFRLFFATFSTAIGDLPTRSGGV